MSTWFEGSNNIECSIQEVKQSLENLGEHFVGVVSPMPGLTSVKLEEQGSDFVIIRTNEGLMKRTNISKKVNANNVIVEYDEEYQAGSRIAFKTHFVEEYTVSDARVKYRVEMRDVEAPGLVGFFYRNFGRSNIGNAVLNSHKKYFENQAD